ncbi:UNVERIFIED_CONTAM: Oleuropein beta-glucosidase [Sesamum latifolium]|uniref:Oleuropein beta-glucosidase n=1 Tax=Sesamum latifolium TaxID=2727402 RepID=A0AAW2U0E8_9LAMI
MSNMFQVEGGYAHGGRSLSNWDVFSIQRPGKIRDGTNGCIAIDHYNQSKEDVALMKKLGLDAYRFSISWSRILPGGRLSGGINRDGVKFYNDLIDELLSQGIEPFVTIFHFDFPQCLENEYGGFLSHRIVQDFAEFAEVCFFEFGDRVKYWITQNEPWSFTRNGYVGGNFPPGRGSVSAQPQSRHALLHRTVLGVDTTCVCGDAGTEPYIVAHNLILAHAVAVDIYRKNYQSVQGGKIGVTNMSTWFDPYTEAQADVDAAARAVDFMWGCQGVNLKGYFLWSLFDNYEWTEGYTVRFGMIYVDYVNGLTRYPKLSAIWYMNFLNKKVLPGPKREVEEKEEDNTVENA